MNKFYTFILLFGVFFWGHTQSYKTYLYQGNQEYLAGQYEKAFEKYQKSVTSNPNSYDAHLGLGNALYKSGKIKEAQKEFNTARNLSQNSKKIASAQFNDANAALKDGKTEEALQKYRKALAKDPTNLGLQRNYALALKKQENQKQNKSSQDPSKKPDPQQKQKDEKEGKEGNQPQNQPNGKSQESGGINGNKQGTSGKNPTKTDPAPQLPKPKNFSEEQKKDILNGIKNRESNTAGRILNKNAYYEPESKEKDW